MSLSVACPHGHSVTLETDDEQNVVCPECGVIFSPASHATDSQPRGLWGVMSAKTETAEETAEAVNPQPKEPQSSDTAPTEHGLWALMGKAPEAAAKTEPSRAPDEAVESQAEGGSGPKGLWSLMQPPGGSDSDTEETGQATAPPDAGASGDHVTADRTADENAAAQQQAQDDDEELEVAPLEELAEEEAAAEVTEESRHTPDLAPPPQAEPTATAPESRRSRGAALASLLGLGSVLISALALLPEFWLRIPGVVVGFLALMVGLLAFGEIRRSRGRQTGVRLAATGMALGALGMLLGPLVFSTVGQTLREKFGRRRTYDNLTVVGDALTQYRRDNDHFPPGTTYRRTKNGDVALHNWMTHLLPYLGDDNAALFKRIDLKEPYSADVNRSPFSVNVPAYFASGASRSKTGTGMAVTHFVAIGGGGVLDTGSRVRVDDVRNGDGLGHTIIAGEIANDFPGWGEPNRSRQFGKGINKSRDGFGNADGTGAMFLKADGSVKFFSNKTDPEVLRQLGTYDGKEKVDPSLIE